nr:hypothetical protein [Tanacetum cinerariifolium]
MVNTRTDAELVVAVQNALQTLLLHIRAEIREEFRTGSGPSYFMHVVLIRGVDVHSDSSRLLFKSFKTLCLFKYALMIRHDYDITVFFTKRVVTIMVSEPKMVNTRTDAELAAAVQNTLQTLLPQIHGEIREEFRIAPVDAENWISHMEKIFDVMGYEDAFKTRLVVYKFE